MYRSIKGKKATLTIAVTLILLVFGGGSLVAFVPYPFEQKMEHQTNADGDSTFNLFFRQGGESLRHQDSEMLDTAALAIMEVTPSGRPKPIRIEVLNGCGIQGAAKTVTNFLRKCGFDVVNIDNAQSFHFDQTIIVDRVGEKSYAQIVGEAIHSKNIIQQQDHSRLLEVTLIIGHDYQDLFAHLEKKLNTP